MKVAFIQPRFEGARFSEHTLPLEVAKDLAAYETLVVELAKHLYLQSHPERQRVPKGFAADFHLHLERVDEGSARTMLCLVAAGLFPPGSDGGSDFARARDLITECVAATDGQLPPAFPRELLVHFNQVGRSLRDDERMELPGAGNLVGNLTPERRKRLVLAADSVYERAVVLKGTIGEADWEESTFRLRLADGDTAVIPMPKDFHARAREYGGRLRHQVTIEGVGAYDSWDKLRKMVSVESVEIQPNYQLSARFESLSTLANGWLEGEGLAPDKVKLSEVAENLIEHYPEELPLPAIAPTPEGNLLLEWDAPGDPSVDLQLDSLRAFFHALPPSGAEIERTFSLSSGDEWQALYAFLCRTLERAPHEPRDGTSSAGPPGLHS